MYINNIQQNYQNKVVAGRSLQAQESCKVNNNVIKARNDLRELLFGSKTISRASDISFGWSKQFGDIEKKILDILTDNDIKKVMVASHKKPDGDALGSCLGICGILESLGKTSYPIIDDNIPRRFRSLPSIFSGRNIESFVKDHNKIKYLIPQLSLDLAVITDCAIPERLGNEVLYEVSRANKVIIIDHHPDPMNGVTNKENWINKLQLLNKSLKRENILFWRESDTTSASEMIAKLDKEIEAEVDIARMNNANPIPVKHYRYSVAAGIATDSGARFVDDSDIPQFFKTSVKRAEAPNGQLMNATEAYYRWLIQNTRSKEHEKNMRAIKTAVNDSVSDKVRDKLSEIFNKKLRINGVIVKQPSASDPYGFVDIQNRKSLKNFVGSLRSRESKINLNSFIDLIKANAIQQTHLNKASVFIVSEYNAMKKSSILTIYSGDDSAIKILDELKELGFGDGGGHQDACVLRLNEGISFDDISTIVEEVVRNVIN
ncbi:MAG: DHH family phosphoesterase [Cyanobacteriota bacterium]